MLRAAASQAVAVNSNGASSLSVRAQALRESLHRWLEALPAGAVRMTEEFEPEEDDYGTELVIRFLPHNKKSSKLLIFCGPDSTGFVLDTCKEISERENLVIPWFTGHGSIACLHSEPWTGFTIERMLEVCEAVAQGRIDLTLGIVFRRLICTRGRIDLPTTSIVTELAGNSMPLVKLLSNYGLGEVRSVEFEPWDDAAERHP